MVPNWVYFGQGEDLKLTTELFKKVQYSRNQAIKNGLNEAILQGTKLTFFSRSHLAPKFSKVVAKSKKLVAI